MVDRFEVLEDSDLLAKLKREVDSNPTLALSSILATAKKVLEEAKERKLSSGQLLELGLLSRKITDLSNRVPLTFYEMYLYPVSHEGKSVKQDTQLVIQELWSYFIKASGAIRGEEF